MSHVTKTCDVISRVCASSISRGCTSFSYFQHTPASQFTDHSLLRRNFMLLWWWSRWIVAWWWIVVCLDSHVELVLYSRCHSCNSCWRWVFILLPLLQFMLVCRRWLGLHLVATPLSRSFFLLSIFIVWFTLVNSFNPLLRHSSLRRNSMMSHGGSVFTDRLDIAQSSWLC
jgi:hypothetical protein